MGRKSGFEKSWTFDNIEALDMNLWGHRSASADLSLNLFCKSCLWWGLFVRGGWRLKAAEMGGKSFDLSHRGDCSKGILHLALTYFMGNHNDFCAGIGGIELND